MKKNIFALFAISLLSSMALVACGSDDDYDPADSVDDYVKSEKDLDSLECTTEREGMVVYLSEEDSRKVCYGGGWVDIAVWRADVEKMKKGVVADDTVSSYSNLPACNYSREDKVFYVKSLNVNLMCVDGDWLEYALQSIPTSVSSISALPACLPSVVGAIVYVSSIGEKVICSDGNWTEYKLWLSSSSSAKSSSSYSSSSYRSSSSSVDILESIFGKCTSARKNEIVYDTNGVVDYYNASTYGYYYCDSYGDWSSPSLTMIDTVGWKAGTDGEFREGQFSYDSWADNYEDLNPLCLIRNSSMLYYVYDGGWREAEDLDVCLLYACTEAREGKDYSFKGYSFHCSNSKWVADSMDMKTKKDWTNPSVTYGELKDTRDGKTYKTVAIGGKTWMAQNLGYKDSTMSTTDYACNDNRDPGCATGGLLYRWTAAMKVSATYGNGSISVDSIKSPHQGICPTGWHLPDTTEWKSLFAAAGNSASLLKATDAWKFTTYTSYTVVMPSNTLGFSAIPSGSKTSSSFSTDNAYFFSSVQAGSSYAYVAIFSYSSDGLTIDDYYKTNYYSVRCVQNAASN